MSNPRALNPIAKTSECSERREGSTLVKVRFCHVRAVHFVKVRFCPVLIDT
jgi:hypothetical protein